MSFFTSIICLCLFTFLATPAFAQGFLTPPGPPGPTMKSLDQTEPRTPISSLPFIITRSGSYYLATNLVAAANANGITVGTNNVTIDLNGFALLGAPGNSAHAITVLGIATNVTVRNGMLQGWYNGLHGANIFHGQFLNLQVSQCTNHGISAGAQCIVRQCLARECSRGIDLAGPCAVTDCSATQNEEYGFYASASSSFLGCHAAYNKSYGFLVHGGSTLVSCTASFNTNGFSLSSGSSAVNCSAFENLFIGIKAHLGSTVRDCNSRENDTGFHVDADSRIVNNTVTRNTSFGILVTGSDNTIDGNHVVDTVGGTGIRANPAIGNLIIRNTLSSNATNFIVHTSNVLAPVITNSVGLSNANPWANFQF